MSQLQQLRMLGGGLGTTLLGGYLLKKCMYSVDTGEKAIKFNKIYGVREQVYKEGFHLLMPFIESPIIFNVKS